MTARSPWTGSVDCFLDRLASSDPAPGGGSAAALAGALGCSLGLMVTAILFSRPKRGAVERAGLLEIRRRLQKTARQLRTLIREDARVYQRLVQAQKSGRGLRKARRAATACPMRICEESARGIKLLRGLSRKTGPYLGADLKAGISLLQGAYQAAEAMVEVNQK